jgi:anti-anti-sigma regulatory factor
VKQVLLILYNNLEVKIMYANVDNIIHMKNSRVEYITCPTVLNKKEKNSVRDFFKTLSANKESDIKIDISALNKVDLWGAELLVKNIKQLKSRSTPVSLYSNNPNSIFLLDTLKVSNIVNIDLINDDNNIPDEVVYN